MMKFRNPLSLANYNNEQNLQKKQLRSKNDHKQTTYSFPKYIFSLTQPVTESLHAKYVLSYYFFTAKYINQLIYSVVRQPQAFQDDIEYLRRTYRHVGLNGKKEIVDRVKLVAKYYDNDVFGGNSVPMMIESKVNDIFVRRIKRLRRLNQQKQHSRSQKSSSSFGSGSLSFSFDQDFLKDVNLQYSELMNDESSQLLNGLEFSEDVHDIYQNSSQDSIKIETLQKLQKFNFKENKVEHLVCDFREINVESVIKFYNDIKKSKNGSIILSEILQQEQKFSKKTSQNENNNKKQKISKLSSQYTLQRTKKSSLIQKQSILSTYRAIFGKKSKSKQSKKPFMKPSLYSTNTLAGEYVNEYKKLQKNVQMQRMKQKRERLI